MPAQSHAVNYDTAYLWERGVREHNEDSLAIASVVRGRERLLFAAVADGIGGLHDGEYASSHVICSLRRSFIEHTHSYNTNLKSLTALMLRTLYSEHIYLSDHGKRTGFDTGTTVSLLCIKGGHAVYMHLGDSRLYRYSVNGTGSLIGRDHIYRDGRLIRAIGTGRYYPADIHRLSLRPGETLLLCTDGFYRRAALLAPTGEDAPFTRNRSVMCKKLYYIYERNLMLGEKDNQSAIVIRRIQHD